MPTAQDIMQFGALGVVLFTFVMLVWKGLPAFRDFLNALILTFKQEIQAERDMGQQLLKEEREANALNQEKLVGAIDRNTQTVEQLRAKVMRGAAAGGN